ncbi:MAG: TonB-dependent receptor [Reichenbachiella sp.]
MKKRILKAFREKCSVLSIVLTQCLLVVFMMGAIANTANANDKEQTDVTVKGRVTDATDGSGIPGVNILVKGSTNGTVTDLEGNYTIVVDEAETLVFSYIGYLAQEAIISGRSTIDVGLELDIKALEEVVVVGYGTQERATVTGAIATVDAKAITEVPVFTADQALQGRAPGVMVMNTGSPGTDPVIRIRGLGTTGSNNPLIVVDGVIVSGMGDVNPNDIASMTVLKDASTTAIFGAKGSNGVVMIVTKNGTSGETKIQLDSYVGVQQVANTYDVMNKEQYLRHAKDNWGYDIPRITDPAYADLVDNDTNWQDQIFQEGIMQSHNLSVSGGGENSDFRIGAGYISQEGVVINTGVDRFTFRANSNFQLGKFKFGETLSTSLTEKLPESNGGGRTVLEHAIKMPPYFGVYNDENIGGYQGTNKALDIQDAENPVRILALPSNSENRINLLGNMYGELEIIDGLKIKGQVGLDYYNYDNSYFTPSFSGDPVAVNQAVIRKSFGTHLQTTTFGTINYAKSFGAHNIDVLLLAENVATQNENGGVTTTNAVTDELQNLTNSVTSSGSFTNEYSRKGYLARANYNYKQKYILAGSYRQDASTRFGSNNRWAPFYSVAAGWVVSEEDFFPSGIITNLKLRGSHGTVGNDNIGDYLYSSSINSSSYISSFVRADGSVYDSQGATAGNVANPDLKWETTTMNNIGIDLGLLNDQITLSAEYYDNVSNDLLVYVELPSSLGGHNGFGARNVGSVQSNGFEFNLGFNDSEGDFQWSANFNLSTTTSLVQSLGGDNNELTGGSFENSNLLRTVEGESLNHFYGWVTDGIFQSEAQISTSADQSTLGGATMPGDIKYKDISGPDGVPDGVVDLNDKVVIGNPIPDMTYGVSLNASYLGFDASLFITGMQGNEIYNTSIWDLEGAPRFFNASPRVLDAWTPENTATDIPRITGDAQNLVSSDRFVEDGSYMRLKNVTLGYSLPNNFMVAGLSKVRFYVSAQNLWTLTDYSGLDPEVGTASTSGGGTNEVGIDRGNYPVAKSFIGGVQINF